MCLQLPIIVQRYKGCSILVSQLIPHLTGVSNIIRCQKLKLRVTRYLNRKASAPVPDDKS
jgi:hypothetical protein